MTQALRRLCTSRKCASYQSNTAAQLSCALEKEAEMKYELLVAGMTDSAAEVSSPELVDSRYSPSKRAR